MEELDVGSDQVLDHIEDAVVVEQIAVVDVAFAHLHDLEHLGAGLVFGVEVVGIVDREVAEPALAAAGAFEFAVIFAAQQFDFVVLEDLANVEVAVDPEAVDLFFGQGFALDGAGVAVCVLHCLELPVFGFQFRVFGFSCVAEYA